jgi:uncharacterized membrane protein
MKTLSVVMKLIFVVVISMSIALLINKYVYENLALIATVSFILGYLLSYLFIWKNMYDS